MNQQIFYSESYRHTEEIGRELAGKLNGNEVIAFFGGLGMGKTAFIRGLASGLGVSPEEVSSPTFAIVHEHSGNVKLFHYDMYRVETWEDLESTGFYEALGCGVLAVEWSENIENALPFPRYEIYIEAGKTSDERQITVRYAETQEGKE